MARSEEAILRRALKRQRTEGQQRYADRVDMYKQQQKQTKKQWQERQVKKQQKNTSPQKKYIENRLKENDQEKQEYYYGNIIVSINDRQPIDKNISSQNTNIENKNDPMNEIGTWVCPKCQNFNFASRRYCNSKTCNDEPRQQHISNNRSKASSRSKPARHNEATSKKIIWSPQADSTTLNKNQLLRKQYTDTNGEGMSLDDIQRAKILIARDERKKCKKKRKKSSEEDSSIMNQSNRMNKGDNKNESTKNHSEIQSDFVASKTDEETDEGANLRNKTDNEEDKSGSKDKVRKVTSSVAKAKRDQNQSLKRMFIETNGIGMKSDQIERAKMLIARDERKKLKRQN